MNRLKRTSKSPFALILAIALSAASLGFPRSSDARGGGVSNGGTSLLCPGQKMPLLLDLEGLPSEIVESFPTDREAFLAEVESRLPTSTEFRTRLRSEWERLGPVEAWPRAETGIPSVADEYAPHTDCDLLTLAVFSAEDHFTSRSWYQAWRSYAIEPGVSLLSERHRRYLELHEAIYIIGARDRGHSNPWHTRLLVRALVSGVDVVTSLADYWHYGFASRAMGPAGVYHLESGASSLCPKWFTWEHVEIDRALLAYPDPVRGGVREEFVAVPESLGNPTKLLARALPPEALECRYARKLFGLDRARGWRQYFRRISLATAP